MNLIYREKYLEFFPDTSRPQTQIPDYIWDRRNFIWKKFDGLPIFMDMLGWMDTIPYKISKHVGKQIEKQCRNTPSVSILDACCGCGGSLVGMMSICSAPQFKFSGCDVSSDRINMCKNNCAAYEFFPSLFQDDIRKVTPKSYDLVFISPPRHTEGDTTIIDIGLYYYALKISCTKSCVLHIPVVSEAHIDELSRKIGLLGDVIAETVYINGNPWGIFLYTGVLSSETPGAEAQKKEEDN